MPQMGLRVAFCPHCGNCTPQRLQLTQPCTEIDWLGEGEEVEEIGLPYTYYVASCETCQHILLYSDFAGTRDEEGFTSAGLEWPNALRLDRAVAKPVAEAYSEAARIKRLAPNAFAVQIRRALEALCQDRSAQGRTLAQKLRDLAGRGEIPPLLVEVTGTLRLLGNIGAHAAEQAVKPWQVNSIDQFFRAVVEYVYVAPSRLASFQRSLNPSADPPTLTPGPESGSPAQPKPWEEDETFSEPAPPPDPTA